MNWNPSAPRNAGLEWRPLERRSLQILGDGVSIGMINKATIGGTVNNVAVYADTLDTAGIISVDVYDLTVLGGLPPPTPLQHLTALPVADVNQNFNQAFWASDTNGRLIVNPYWTTGSSFNFMQLINNRSNFLGFASLNAPASAGGGVGGEFGFAYKFDPVELNKLIGKRPVSIRSTIIASNFGTNVGTSQYWVGFGRRNDTDPTRTGPANSYNQPVGTTTNNTPVALSATWDRDPATELPWTWQVLQTLGGGITQGGLEGWVFGYPYGYGPFPAVYVMAVDAYYTDEFRSATGSKIVVPGGNGWLIVPMADLNGQPFKKTAGHTYLYIIRSIDYLVPDSNKLDGPRIMFRTQWSVPVLDSGDTDVVEGSFRFSHHGERPVVIGTPTDSAGGIVAAPPALSTRNSEVTGLVQLAGLTAIADSQPYVDLVARNAKNVNVTASQDLRTGFSAPYGAVRCILGWFGGVQPQSALTIRLATRNAPGTTLGWGSVQPTDLTSSRISSGQPVNARVVLHLPDPAAPTDPERGSGPIPLSAGTQYMIEFVADPSDTWQIYGLDDKSGGGFSTTNFGGLVGDNAHYDGLDVNSLDFVVSIGQAPGTPVLAAPVIV